MPRNVGASSQTVLRRWIFRQSWATTTPAMVMDSKTASGAAIWTEVVRASNGTATSASPNPKVDRIMVAKNTTNRMVKVTLERYGNSNSSPAIPAWALQLQENRDRRVKTQRVPCIARNGALSSNGSTRRQETTPMKLRAFRSVFICLLFVSLGFGQVGSGTITGTVTDQGGAVVPAAVVEARNTETGVIFRGTSTNTGNYAIPDLPVGTYVITVQVQGFKAYTHANLALSANQVLPEDITLQIGNAAESVTVTDQATLLATQTGELAHNITLKQIDDLPLMGIGTANAGVAGFRNPFNVLESLPGLSNYVPDYGVVFNGLSGTESIRIEGQDATQHILPAYSASAQPGADAIQEVSFQTSNYAPEYGTVGSVVINFNMKSGTNQYHGSGYDYFVNEDLNAGNPFTVNSSGVGKLRPRNRRNDFGGTLGG